MKGVMLRSASHCRNSPFPYIVSAATVSGFYPCRSTDLREMQHRHASFKCDSVKCGVVNLDSSVLHGSMISEAMREKSDDGAESGILSDIEI